MNTEICNCEQHFERVVDYFIKRYQLNLIPYEKFLIGYDIFSIGKAMKFERSTSIIVNFLLTVHVETTTVEESQNVIEMQYVMGRLSEKRQGR